MHHRRPAAGWFGLLMVWVLLFAQQAALAHVCVRIVPTSAPATPLERMAEGIADTRASVPATLQMPCEGHGASDTDGANSVAGAGGPALEERLLCKAHCQADEQSVNSAAAAADLLPASLLGLVPWHQPRLGDLSPGGRPVLRATPDGPPAGALPLYLSLLVLRN